MVFGQILGDFLVPPFFGKLLYFDLVSCIEVRREPCAPEEMYTQIESLLMSVSTVYKSVLPQNLEYDPYN